MHKELLAEILENKNEERRQKNKHCFSFYIRNPYNVEKDRLSNRSSLRALVNWLYLKRNGSILFDIIVFSPSLYFTDEKLYLLRESINTFFVC